MVIEHPRREPLAAASCQSGAGIPRRAQAKVDALGGRVKRALALAACFIGLTVAARGQEVAIEFLSPAAGCTVFGETLVQGRGSSSSPLKEVELWMDGRRLGSLEPPEFQLWVDVGEENREHRFEIVARTASGAETRVERICPPLQIDDSIDLRLQQLFVTVRNLRGGRVLGLSKKDFVILDNKEEQILVTLESGDIPFSAILLLDASLSMKGPQMKAVELGARAFVEGLADFDEARLMAFSDRLLAASPFTKDPEELLAAIPSRPAAGGTAVHDHLFWSVRLLQERLGRKVILLLSDGADVHSVLAMETVAEALRRSDILLYWIRILSPEVEEGIAHHSFLPALEIRQQRDRLRREIRRSGGRTFKVRQPEEIVAALAEVLRELREQYALGYYPRPPSDREGWHRVEVKVQGLGLRSRSREGYFPAHHTGGQDK